jgi:transcription-repair coupling factor (superfamily II helicase)
MIETVRVRWMAEELGIEKINLKSNNLKCYFVSSENERYYKSATFGKILDHVQKHSKKCSLKEAKGRLVLLIDNVLGIEEVKSMMKEILMNEKIIK